MEAIQDLIAEAIKANILCEFMGWDEKHGPTLDQIDAFNILFPEFKL